MESSELEKKMMEIGIKKIKGFYADSAGSAKDQSFLFQSASSSSTPQGILNKRR